MYNNLRMRRSYHVTHYMSRERKQFRGFMRIQMRTRPKLYQEYVTSGP